MRSDHFHDDFHLQLHPTNPRHSVPVRKNSSRSSTAYNKNDQEHQSYKLDKNPEGNTS